MFIAVAVLMILSAAMGFMADRFIQQMKGETEFPMPDEVEKMGWPFGAMSMISKYFGLLAIVQIAFAVFMLIAGIQFLRLRSWARAALEVISWLGLVYVVGFGILWFASWTSMTAGLPIPETTQHPFPWWFEIFELIMLIAVLAVFVIPTIVIIKFLRGKTIREAMIQKIS